MAYVDYRDHEEGERLIISVHDTGTGIPART